MRRALVFAHFDPHGLVDDTVMHALAVYRQHFELVHFVSTAGLDAAQVRRAAGLVDRVITRANVGYDFMSWRVGFAALPKHVPFDVVVFANDSVYGPVAPMPPFWAKVDALGADLWGASINRQHMPHVQSYFMGFGARLLGSGFAARFLDGVEVIEDKLALISRYEVGLTRLAEAEGFRVDGVVQLREGDTAMRAQVMADNASTTDPDAAEAIAFIRSGADLNPMQLGWARSLRAGSPFVKVELLRDNPLHANLHRLLEVLGTQSLYDVQMILRHLERTACAGGIPARSNGRFGRAERGLLP